MSKPCEPTSLNTNRPPPRIVSAAMLMDDGSIVMGIRHFSPDMRAVLRRLYGTGFKFFGVWLKKPYYLRVVEQGFVDQYGEFYDREEAWEVADREGQIRKNLSVPGSLFSENLY